MNHVPHPPVMPRQRPGTVTAAAALMVGMTVIFVIIGGIMVYGLMTMEASSNSEERALQITGIITGLLCFVVGLSVIGLALGVLRGRNGARIATFVVYAIFILFGMCGLGVWLLGMSRATGGNTALGGVVLLGLTLFEVVILAVTVALLASASARDWFAAHTRARHAGLL